MRDWILERWRSSPSVSERQPGQILTPVCYGGADGPDLENVARIRHLFPSDVVRMHSAPVYRVGMMGFTPGFACLMGLDTGLTSRMVD